MENESSMIAEKIREYGISLCLNDKEIDSCLISSFLKWHSNNVKTPKKQVCLKTKYYKELQNKIFCFAVITLSLITIFIAFKNDTVRLVLYRFMGNHVIYPVMRVIRLAVLPIITKVDMSSE